MKKSLLLLATFLGLVGCGVADFSAPGTVQSTAVRLVPEDSAAMAFADSLAASRTLHKPATRVRPGSRLPLTH